MVIRKRTHTGDRAAMEYTKAVLATLSLWETGARRMAWETHGMLFLDVELEVHDAGSGGRDA